jgi:hypothetical protein
MRKYNFWKSDAAIQKDFRHAYLLQLMKLNHMKRVSIPQLCVLAYSQKQVQSCSQLKAKNMHNSKSSWMKFILYLTTRFGTPHGKFSEIPRGINKECLKLLKCATSEKPQAYLWGKTMDFDLVTWGLHFGGLGRWNVEPFLNLGLCIVVHLKQNWNYFVD